MKIVQVIFVLSLLLSGNVQAQSDIKLNAALGEVDHLSNLIAQLEQQKSMEDVVAYAFDLLEKEPTNAMTQNLLTTEKVGKSLIVLETDLLNDGLSPHSIYLDNNNILDSGHSYYSQIMESSTSFSKPGILPIIIGSLLLIGILALQVKQA